MINQNFKTINHDTDLEFQLQELVRKLNKEFKPTPTITGSRASGAALADLLTKLAAIGLIIDGSSA